jgi:hypothetical protein
VDVGESIESDDPGVETRRVVEEGSCVARDQSTARENELPVLQQDGVVRKNDGEVGSLQRPLQRAQLRFEHQRGSAKTGSLDALVLKGDAWIGSTATGVGHPPRYAARHHGVNSEPLLNLLDG